MAADTGQVPLGRPAPVVAPGPAILARPAERAPAPEAVREPRVEPALEAPPAPAWPPPGDRGPLAEPVSRVPAGLYLPPSAVLPPGEALPIPAANTHAEAAPAPAETAPERISAADRLASLELPADTPRRVVAIGAVVAALGFLLPWTASPTGNDVLGDYLVRWGLAGPGAWLVVGLLLALAGLTLAGGRFALTSVGLPGVALAMLLLGLGWPYLFGFPARGVGLWVVMGGVLLLAVGGVLDMRAGRHDHPRSTVQ
jgi:hypothetical protein